jgi:uncharacterized protein YjbJ (UPF0337 family)
MNTNQVKGTLKNLKGKVKEKVGHLTGNTKTELSGIKDQVTGKTEKAWGDIKEKAKS